MKKTAIVLGMMLLVVVVGCANKNDEQATYQGELVEKVAKTKDGYQVFLKNVEVIDDAKDPVSFAKDGVKLNIDAKTIENISNFDNLDKGSKIKFVVKTPTVTTMSIPPQIAGNSIISIEVIK